jgi:Uma2 family endonuclease
MTAEEFLALPDNDGVDRELIRGELRERPMTYQNRRHSPTEARIAKLLGNWLDTQPEPRGEIASGEAGFLLRDDTDTIVGIDVAYVSHEVVSRNPEGVVFKGPPVLAVEILSPSDTHEDIEDKLALYFSAGAPLVWIVNPRARTVEARRPDAEPVTFNASQDLTAEPRLPGFRVPVARLFPAR